MVDYPKYERAPWNSKLGLAIMRQSSATENSQMIVAIMLPKSDAENLADNIIDILNDCSDVQ